MNTDINGQPVDCAIAWGLANQVVRICYGGLKGIWRVHRRIEA